MQNRYQEADLLLPMEPLYEFLAQQKWDLDILVYSGDDVRKKTNN